MYKRQRLDIAVAADGTPWLAYIKDNEPMVATFDGTAWETTVIGAQYSAENYISIALDEDGKPHVAFYSPSESALIYGVFDEGFWSLEVVDAAGPFLAALRGRRPGQKVPIKTKRGDDTHTATAQLAPQPGAK